MAGVWVVVAAAVVVPAGAQHLTTHLKLYSVSYDRVVNDGLPQRPATGPGGCRTVSSGWGGFQRQENSAAFAGALVKIIGDTVRRSAAQRWIEASAS